MCEAAVLLSKHIVVMFVCFVFVVVFFSIFGHSVAVPVVVG